MTSKLITCPNKGSEVSIAGTFNDWQPEKMTLSTDKSCYEYMAKGEPGKAIFKFINAEGEWILEEGLPTTPDEFSNLNHRIMLEESALSDVLDASLETLGGLDKPDHIPPPEAVQENEIGDLGHSVINKQVSNNSYEPVASGATKMPEMGYATTQKSDRGSSNTGSHRSRQSVSNITDLNPSAPSFEPSHSRSGSVASTHRRPSTSSQQHEEHLNPTAKPFTPHMPSFNPPARPSSASAMNFAEAAKKPPSPSNHEFKKPAPKVHGPNPTSTTAIQHEKGHVEGPVPVDASAHVHVPSISYAKVAKHEPAPDAPIHQSKKENTVSHIDEKHQDKAAKDGKDPILTSQVLDAGARAGHSSIDPEDESREDVTNLRQAVTESTAEKAQNTEERVADIGSRVAEKKEEVLDPVVENLKEHASEIKSEVAAKADSVLDSAQADASSVKHKVAEKAHDAQEAARNLSKDLPDKAMQQLDHAQTTAGHVAQQVSSKAESVKEDALNKASSGIEHAKEVGMDTKAEISSKAESAVESAKEAGNSVAESARSAVQSVSEETVELKEQSSAKISDAQEVIAEKSALANDLATEQLASANDVITEKTASAKEVMIDVSSSVQEVVVDKTTSAYDSLLEGSASVQESVYQEVKAVQEALPTTKEVKDGAASIAEKVSTKSADAAQEIKENTSSLANSVTQKSSRAYEEARETASTTTAAIVDKSSGIAESVSDSTPAKDIKDQAIFVQESVTAQAEKAQEQAKKTVEDVTSTLSAVVDDLDSKSASLERAGAEQLDSVRDSAYQKVEIIQEQTKPMLDNVREKLSDGSESIKETSASMIESIQETVSTNVSNIAEIVRERAETIVESVSQQATSVSESIREAYDSAAGQTYDQTARSGQADRERSEPAAEDINSLPTRKDLDQPIEATIIEPLRPSSAEVSSATSSTAEAARESKRVSVVAEDAEPAAEDTLPIQQTLETSAKPLHHNFDQTVTSTSHSQKLASDDLVEAETNESFQSQKSQQPDVVLEISPEAEARAAARDVTARPNSGSSVSVTPHKNFIKNFLSVLFGGFFKGWTNIFSFAWWKRGNKASKSGASTTESE